MNLIMYGNQSFYKGTDIFVDALNLLPIDLKLKVRSTIVGSIEKNFYQELKQKTIDLDVEWIPEYVTDDFLYKKIMVSDAIIIPYREISQSGVLLLALSFKRMIIASDLPGFKETLTGFNDEMFFENGNAESLAKVIEYCLKSTEEKREKYKSIIQSLCDKYSWNKIGKNTMSLYEKNLNGC